MHPAPSATQRSGFNTFTFDNRRTFTVAGERLYYHPSGYTGTQYAGGWAVNGGAAQWWNQVMPLSDNAHQLLRAQRLPGLDQPT